MRVTMACVPKPGDRRNEDFVGAVPSAVVVVDGAGGIPGADAACAHGVAWYARRLGAHLLMTLPDDDRSLTAQLAAAIGAARGDGPARARGDRLPRAGPRGRCERRGA